jgi:hypothetical protein
LRQEGLNARAEVLSLLLGELVEEATGTDQAVLIRRPVEILLDNKPSNLVTILFDQSIEVLKDVGVDLLVLAIGVNEKLFMTLLIACCLMHDR